MPDDFCAALTDWQASGWNGLPVDVSSDIRLKRGDPDRWMRALKVLMNHGAKFEAFLGWLGEPTLPELREPAPDPIAELLAKAANPRVTDPDAPGRSLLNDRGRPAGRPRMH